MARFFIVSRGFGPGATPTNLVARGFIPVVGVVTVVRGAVRRGRRAKEQFKNFIEELKVSVALITINGKELVDPIINTVRTSYRDKEKPEIRVTPTKLTVKQPDIKVKVAQVRKLDVSN